MIYAFLANGFEEVEAIAAVDVIRRAGIDIATVGIGDKRVTGSHGITVVCDLDEAQADINNFDGVLLPGGMPGTLNLEKSGTDYLKDKTIALNKLEISIEEEKNKVTVSCEGKSGPLIARILNKKSIGTSSSVKKSAPDDFIRMVNAVRNALE